MLTGIGGQTSYDVQVQRLRETEEGGGALQEIGWSRACHYHCRHRKGKWRTSVTFFQFP